MGLFGLLASSDLLCSLRYIDYCLLLRFPLVRGFMFAYWFPGCCVLQLDGSYEAECEGG